MKVFQRFADELVSLSLPALAVAFTVATIGGCGPSSVAPEDEVPAAEVIDPVVGDPAAVEGAESPDSAATPATPN